MSVACGVHVRRVCAFVKCVFVRGRSSSSLPVRPDPSEMLMMMDCSNRKPPVDLSGVVVTAAAAAAAAAAGAVPSSPEPGVAGTWHPHVYGNPPRAPTAHNIADILGWTARSKTAAGPGSDEQPLNLSTARRPNGTTVLDLTKIKRKGRVATARFLENFWTVLFHCGPRLNVYTRSIVQEPEPNQEKRPFQTQKNL